MTTPNNVNAGDLATAEWANQLLAVVRDLDAANDVVSITRSGAQLVVTQRDGTTTRIDIPSGGGTDLPAFQQSEEEVLHSRAGSLYWDPIREVPIAGSVGHILTVTGENDDDYAWRAAPEGGGGGDTSGLDRRITTNASNISELETEVATASRSIADNEGRITTAETDIGQRATTAQLQQAIRDLGSTIGDNTDAIADISENEVRVIGISGWDAHDNARTLHIAIYPPEAIGRNQTLRFTVGGIAATGTSGDGIDANGGVVEVTISAANSATITRSAARDGHVEIDWIYGGNTYHGYVDYVPPVTIPATRSRILLAATAATTTDTLTLPTSYPTFKWFTIVGANSGGGSGSVTVPTAWLAAHTTQGTITYPTTQNGQTGRYTWGVTLRTIEADSNSSIQYAELHD